MDIQRPDLNGRQATEIIRRQKEEISGAPPIIALTAHAMSDDRPKCLEAGMDDYIAKPINADFFYATIKKYLK